MQTSYTKNVFFTIKLKLKKKPLKQQSTRRKNRERERERERERSTLLYHFYTQQQHASILTKHKLQTKCVVFVVQHKPAT
jgi:hypothetical protein